MRRIPRRKTHYHHRWTRVNTQQEIGASIEVSIWEQVLFVRYCSWPSFLSNLRFRFHSRLLSFLYALAWKLDIATGE